MPYGWWGYCDEQMLGLVVKPLCDLPIEAVLVWSLVSRMTALVYEVILSRKLILAKRVEQGEPALSLWEVLGAPPKDVGRLKETYCCDSRAPSSGE